MQEEPSSANWYEEWFDTPYYHKLYKHRDETEARQYIDQLVSHLRIPQGAHILDLACGRGRHAVYLSQKGHSVTGIDLSENNIAYASRFANEKLNFETGDMRENLGEERFDYVLNLFTSFGYFRQDEDDLRAVKNVYRSLKKSGVFVIDFMNVEKVIRGLVEEEVKEAGGIRFRLNRFVREDFIVKEIRFTDKGKDHRYYERVKILKLADFQRMFDAAGFVLSETFGDFQLNPFDEESSERLILVAEKKI